MYGHAGLFGALRRAPRLTTAAAWGVIVFECTFPAIFFVGPELQLVVIAAGLGFHATTARFMGLNGFLFAFSAVYRVLIWSLALGA